MRPGRSNRHHWLWWLTLCILVQVVTAGKHGLPVQDHTPHSGSESSTPSTPRIKLPYEIQSPAASDSTRHVYSTDGSTSDDVLKYPLDSPHSPEQRPIRPMAQRDRGDTDRPHNPGPHWSATLAAQEHTIIAGGNITNFWSFLASAEHLDGDVYIVQEHGIRHPQLGQPPPLRPKAALSSSQGLSTRPTTLA